MVLKLLAMIQELCLETRKRSEGLERSLLNFNLVARYQAGKDATLVSLNTVEL